MDILAPLSSSLCDCLFGDIEATCGRNEILSQRMIDLKAEISELVVVLKSANSVQDKLVCVISDLTQNGLS
jgi:hypothetical protein